MNWLSGSFVAARIDAKTTWKEEEGDNYDY